MQYALRSFFLLAVLASGSYSARAATLFTANPAVPSGAAGAANPLINDGAIRVSLYYPDVPGLGTATRLSRRGPPGPVSVPGDVAHRLRAGELSDLRSVCSPKGEGGEPHPPENDAAVPEPASILVAGGGIVLLAGLQRLRRPRKAS